MKDNIPFKDIDKLVIKTNGGVRIELDMSYKVTFMIGDSGTGKSYLCDKLDSLIYFPYNISECNIDINNLVVCSGKKDIDLTLSDRIIVIDRYPVYNNIGAVNKFIAESYNKFIIMTHHLFNYDLPVDDCDVVELKCTNDGQVFRTKGISLCGEDGNISELAKDIGRRLYGE
jgi:hypothetical protein